MSIEHVKITNVTKTKQFSQYDYLCEIIFLGEAGVGKSSILKMYAESKFEINPVSTIGIDFLTSFMKVETIQDNAKPFILKLQVWDCAGQEKYKSIVDAYMRDSNVIVYTFDITDSESFNRIYDWKQRAENKLGINNEKTYMNVLVGNKIDMMKDRTVIRDNGLTLAEQLNTFYAEVSAKNEQDISRLFEEITKHIYTKMIKGELHLDHISNFIGTNTISITNTHPDPHESDENEFVKCFRCNT